MHMEEVTWHESNDELVQMMRNGEVTGEDVSLEDMFQLVLENRTRGP